MFWFSFVQKYGRTALMYASQNGHAEVALALMDRGADVNKSDVSADARCTAAVTAHCTALSSVQQFHWRM